MYVYEYEGWNRYSIYSYIHSVTQVFKYQKNIWNDFTALILAYVIIKYRFKGIFYMKYNLRIFSIHTFVVNGLFKHLDIFVHSTIWTLNFRFISALVNMDIVTHY